MLSHGTKLQLGLLWLTIGFLAARPDQTPGVVVSRSQAQPPSSCTAHHHVPTAPVETAPEATCPQGSWTYGWSCSIRWCLAVVCGSRPEGSTPAAERVLLGSPFAAWWCTLLWCWALHHTQQDCLWWGRRRHWQTWRLTVHSLQGLAQTEGSYTSREGVGSSPSYAAARGTLTFTLSMHQY